MPAPTMRKRIRYTFRVICEAEVYTTICTIFGRPGQVEPLLSEEFTAIFAALFPGELLIEESSLEDLPLFCALPEISRD